MKITKDMVGKKVRLSDSHECITITAVGEEYFLAKDSCGEEWRWDVDCNCELYEEPKKTVKMWPAFIEHRLIDWDEDGSFKKVTTTESVTPELFANEEDARAWCGVYFISWPAIPNPDGSYDVPEVK